MTGPVEWQTLLWIVGAIGGAFVFGVVIMWRVVGWVQNALTTRDLAIEAAEKAATLSVQVIDARAKLSEEMISKALSSHQLYSAEHFVTKDGLGAALHDVQTSIDRLSDLLNQLLVQAAGGLSPMQPKPRSQRQRSS